MKGTNKFEEQSVTERCDLQDHIVPYMLDERHVEDTLFIVVEEDFRFFNEEQGEPIAPKLELKASQSFLQSALEPEMLDSFPGEADKLLTLQSHWQTRVGVPGDHKKSTSSSSRDELSFTTRATKPTRKELEGESPSPLLENLVRLCTAAHRKHIGDIVWFCYNEDDHKKCTMFPEPQFGSNGIAVSRPGARWIQKEFPNMPVWHWDVELKKRLELGHARASYMCPPVGHWTKHASAVLAGNATRDPTWWAWFVQEGVAPVEPRHIKREL